MKKNLFFSSFFCIMLMMTGCSSAVEITADLMPMATTDYPDYIEMTSPETEKIKPTFPPRETESVPEITASVSETLSLSDELYQEISQFHSLIQFDRKIEKDEISAAITELEWEHPEIFWINGYSMKYNDVSAEITLKIMDNYSIDTLRQMSQELDRTANAVLEQINLSASDYEKALQVHDYLVQHTEYDQSAVSKGKGLWSTAYGCLVNGSAVCQGYSQAFQILMNKMGIECGICSGNAKGEAHAWNYINLNGQYYWIDVTWDDPVSENYNFDWIHHGYFLIDDRMLARSRTFDSNGQFVPLCASLDENYFVRNGNYLTEYYFSEIDRRLTEHQSEGRIEIMFSTPEAYQMAVNDLFNSETIWNAQIFQATGGTINYQTDEDMYVLRLIFTVNP
ncbi:MAG: hypothetical protein IJ642_04690 [Oscillospiraceae bacterium]|nr:hypothetical protein [Oscillospiraceae bacterium]